MNVKHYTKQDLEKFYILREGETKLGEKVHVLNDLDVSIKTAKALGARYAIIGIPESIGVRANLGRSGTEDAWQTFLKKFLNMQHNQFLRGENIIVLGEIVLDDLKKEAKNLDKRNPEDLKKLRALTAKIDDLVYPIIKQLVAHDLIPIVIGGGHNNAYPLIKGLSLAKNSKVSVINLDAHADFRLIEGRHSGNPFSYAYEDNYLENYVVIGLNEQYNSETMIKKLLSFQREGKVDFVTHEDIIKNNYWFEAITRAKLFIEKKELPLGLEIDLDSVQGIPASAVRPSGITLNQTREFVQKISEKASYLHVCEGAPSLGMDGVNIVGKAISYLVSDFIKRKK